MSEEFKNAFDKLSIKKKRNQISNELLIIGELIKNIENILLVCIHTDWRFGCNETNCQPFLLCRSLLFAYDFVCRC